MDGNHQEGTRGRGFLPIPGGCGGSLCGGVDEAHEDPLRQGSGGWQCPVPRAHSTQSSSLPSPDCGRLEPPPPPPWVSGLACEAEGEEFLRGGGSTSPCPQVTKRNTPGCSSGWRVPVLRRKPAYKHRTAHSLPLGAPSALDSGPASSAHTVPTPAF